MAKFTQNQKLIAAFVGLFLFARIAKGATSGGTGGGGIPSGGNGAADVDYRGTSAPRGIRNNNPGNLRKTSIPWQGKVPLSENTDGAFEQFYKYKYGIRAMLKDLHNDFRVDGLNTITKLINAYAPSSENDTGRYISDVSAWTGIGANTPLSDNYGTWKKLVIAMARKENGKVDAITPAQFDQTWTEFNF
jgi:hypothetical protein